MAGRARLPSTQSVEWLLASPTETTEMQFAWTPATYFYAVYAVSSLE